MFKAFFIEFRFCNLMQIKTLFNFSQRKIFNGFLVFVKFYVKEENCINTIVVELQTIFYCQSNEI